MTPSPEIAAPAAANDGSIPAQARPAGGRRIAATGSPGEIDVDLEPSIALGRPAAAVRNAILAAVCAVLCAGCSISRFAVNRVGDALAGGAGTYASDEDPELVGAALPFSLKLVESLLAESPQHRGLLVTAASGFTQYAYGFVQLPAEQVEHQDLEFAWAEKERARRLFLRARDYGLRGLETRHEGLRGRLEADPRAALTVTDRDDVELLYWTAAAWGSAVGLAKDDPRLVGDLPRIEALADRALELHPDFGDGALHSFMINWEMIRAGAEGDPAARATEHFRRAVELSGGREAGPYVTYAEAVCRTFEDRRCFREALEQALAIDLEAKPSARLANVLMQRRARWLLDSIDRLILPPLDPDN